MDRKVYKDRTPVYIMEDKPRAVNKTLAVLNDPKYKEIVDQSMAEMDAMALALTDAGKSPEEAKLIIQQEYFKNLKMASEPAVMMQKTMAELATRISIDRVMNPESDLVSEKYQKLVDLQIRALKAQASLDKKISLSVQGYDDKSVSFEFIDVEDS